MATKISLKEIDMELERNYTSNMPSSQRRFIVEQKNMGDAENLDLEKDYEQAMSQFNNLENIVGQVLEKRSSNLILQNPSNTDNQISQKEIKKKQQRSQNYVPPSNSEDVWRRGGLSIATKIKSAGQKFLNFSETFRFRNLNQRDMGLINDRSSNYEAIYLMDLLNQKPSSLEKFQFKFFKKLNRLFSSTFLNNLIKERGLNLLLKPDSLFKNIWSLCILIILLVNFYHFSFKIVFAIEYQQSLSVPTQQFFQNAPLVFFLIDIVLKLNTSIYQGGIVIVDRIKIVQSYVMQGFLYDAGIIISIIFGDQSESDWLQFIQTVQIIKINRIFSQLADNLQLSDLYDAFLKLAHLLLKICLTAHLCGLLFIYITQFQKGENWMQKNNIQEQNWGVQYVLKNQKIISLHFNLKHGLFTHYLKFTCLYWAVVTMITLGYGDIVPINLKERITVIAISLVACGMFAYSFNQIGSIFHTLNESQVILNKKLKMIRVYLQKRNVNYDLNIKLNRYFQYIFQRQLENDSECDLILNQLTPELQKEISQDIYGRLLKETKSFNLNFSKKVLTNLAPYVKEQQYQAETVILQKDTDNKRFFFILDGIVQMSYPIQNQKQNVAIQHLQKGDIFGKDSFFMGQYEHFNYISKNIVNVAYIQFSDFVEALKKCPTELQKYFQKRDWYFFNGVDGFDMQCEICHAFQHKPETCPRVTYNVNQQRIIFKYDNEDAIQQERTEFNRFQQKKFHSRNIAVLHEDAIDILTDLDYYKNQDFLDAQIELIEQSLEGYSDNLQIDGKLEGLLPSRTRKSVSNFTMKSSTSFAQFPDDDQKKEQRRDQRGTLIQIDQQSYEENLESPLYIEQKKLEFKTKGKRNSQGANSNNVSQMLESPEKFDDQNDLVIEENSQIEHSRRRQTIQRNNDRTLETFNRLQTMNENLKSQQSIIKNKKPGGFEFGDQFKIRESFQTEMIKEYDSYYPQNNFSVICQFLNQAIRPDLKKAINAKGSKSLIRREEKEKKKSGSGKSNFHPHSREHSDKQRLSIILKTIK